MGRLRIFAGCAVVWALIPAAVQAAPEGDATIRIDPFIVQDGGFGDGQAFCPPDTRLVGGGVTSTPVGDGLMRVNGPLDPTGLTSNLENGDVGRSWYANAGANTAPSQNTYVSSAICSAGSDATIRVDPFTVQAGQYGQGQAFCPVGSRVIGGGVTGTGATESTVGVSGPLDETGLTSNLENGDVGRSWYAYLYNNGPGPNTFVSTAICSPGSDATIRVDSVTLIGAGLGDAQAVCLPGTRVVGGGVTTTGTTNEYFQVSGPLDDSGLASNLQDGAVGRSWYAHVYNAAGQNTFVSTAICAPPPSTTEGAVQTCKGKKATIAARPGAHGRKFSGTSNKDVIVGTDKKDKIKAGAGNDLVCAGKGNDMVKGGKAKDKLFGEGGRDTLLGQAGKDLLSGGGKNDTCVGGPGKDTEKSC